MNFFYIFILILAIFLTFLFTKIIRFFTIKYNIVDKPDESRKIHKVSTPLLGGLAIFLAFFLLAFFVREKLLIGDLEVSHWLGVFVGAFILMIGGFLDDKYNLKPSGQIIFPILAAIAVILGGVEIEKITNPLGGFIYLNEIKLLGFLVVSDVLIFLWLMGMMYTTKILDGIDGLVTGVTGIGAFIIFLFTMTTKYYQPDIGLASLILAGACLGFLILNWYPAKIFLGEGGSLLLGFLLGTLAIISGGKIAIALLIMGVPILDLVWTILRRLKEGKNPFKFADRKHLHFRLLDSGLSQRKTVLIFYLFSTLFGLSALFLQSTGKIFALGVLVFIMILIIFGFNYIDSKKNAKKT